MMNNFERKVVYGMSRRCKSSVFLSAHRSVNPLRLSCGACAYSRNGEVLIEELRIIIKTAKLACSKDFLTDAMKGSFASSVKVALGRWSKVTAGSRNDLSFEM